MSTVSQRPARRGQQAPEPMQAAPPPPRRLRRLLLLALVATVALAWFAPWLIAHTPLRNLVLTAVLGKGNGTMTAGSAQLGWNSPLQFNDIQLHDLQGTRVLSVPSVSTDKTLLALLTRRVDLGTVRIERPTLVVRFDRQGSNLDPLIKPWTEGPSTGTAPRVAVHVVDGRLLVHDGVHEQEWDVGQLNAEFLVAPQSANPLVVRAAAQAANKADAATIRLEIVTVANANDNGANANGNEAPGGSARSAPGQKGHLALTTHAIPVRWFTLLAPAALADAPLEGTMTADCRCDFHLADQLSVDDLQVTAKTDYVQLQASGTLDQLTAVAHYNLGQLAEQFTSRPAPPDAWHVQGQGTTQVNLTRQADGDYRAKITTDVQQLRVFTYLADGNAQPADQQTQWHEPLVSVEAVAAYSPTGKRLDVSECRVASQSLAVQVAGSLDRIDEEPQWDVTATVRYASEDVMPLIERYLGTRVRLAGGDQASVRMTGPLFPHQPATDGQSPTWIEQLTCDAQMGWPGADVYGVSVGRGAIQARLADGVLRFEPFQLPAAGGHVTAAPLLRLDTMSPELMLPPGPLLTRIRVTPQVTRSMLMYIAPVLADALHVDGQCSLDLEHCRMVLSDTSSAQASGQLQVHQLQASPGPLARELILLSQQIEALAKRRVPPQALGDTQRTLVEIRDNTIPFQLQDRRVYHRGLDLVVGRVSLRTYGSVGFDQTLAMVVEVPVDERWIGNDPITQQLRGQTVQIPVHGTLSQPQLDRRAFEQLSANLLRGAAKKAVADELNRQLEKQLQKLLPLPQ